MSKKGSGPPPLQVGSKPPLPPLQADEGQTLAFADETLTDVEPDARDLLSSAMPDGLSNPYASAGGWIVDLQEPYSAVPGASGPLSSYVGANVEAYTNVAAVSDAASSSSSGASQAPATLADLWAAYVAAVQAEQLAQVASNLPFNQPGGPVYNSDHGFIIQPDTASDVPTTPTPPSVSPVQTIPEVTIVGDTSANDQSLMQAIEAAVRDSALMQAMQDAVGQPSPPSNSPPTSIYDVLSGTDWLPSTSTPASQPPPSSAPTAPPTETPAQQDWTAGWHGMVDSYIDLVDTFLKIPSLPGLPPLPASIDFLKFGPPPTTGNELRDYERRDSYNKGRWFTTTVSMAAPLGVSAGARAAAAAVDAVEGGGVAAGGAASGELGILGNEIGGSVDAASTGTQVRQLGDIMNWNGRNFAVVTDTQTGTTRIWYQSSGANATAGTWYPTYGIDTGNALGQAENWIAKGLDAPGFLYNEQADAAAAGKQALSSTLNEAIRGGASQYDAAFEWANSGGIQGTPVPSVPAEINATGMANGAPVIEQTISRFMTRLYGGW